MSKRVCLFVLCLLLVTSLVCSAQSAHRVELSLEQAIDTALTHNLDLQLALIDLEQAQAALARAQFINDEEMIKTAAEQLEKQQQTYDNTRQKLISSVRTAYFELLQQEETVANQAKALERSKNQLNIDQAKFEAGVISTLDLQRSQNSVSNAEIAYANAIIALETKYYEFNRTLGLDLTTQVVLTDVINVDFVPFTLELEQAYQMALAHNQTIAAAKQALADAIEAVKAADNPYTPLVDLEKAKVEQQKAEIRLKQAEINLYLQIRNSYYQVKNAAENVQTKEKELILEQQLLLAEETKYKAGMISNQAIVAQQEKLAQAENAYTQALWNYGQLRYQFLLDIGLDPEA